MHGRKILHGRKRAADRLHLHVRLLVHVYHDHRMRGQHRDVPCLWRRHELCGGRRPGGRLQLLRGVRLNFHDIERLRHDVIHVCYDRLWCGPCVCWRVRPACSVFL